MRGTPIPMDGGVRGLLVGAAIVAIGSMACAGAPVEHTSGECCVFTGPAPHDCAAIESLGPGADLDGRCNQVNQGQSCAWLYSKAECCEIAVADGFGNVTCEDPEGTSGDCCIFTGPAPHDCASIESLGPGADLDGRCNQVNQGQSCAWIYADAACCEIAVSDGFPGNVECN